MGIIRCTALVIVMLGLTAPAHGQELKQDGVLKKDGTRVVAALAFAPGDRVVVAYVAGGTEGAKEKLTNWAEVRLLDVASGKHRVLARTATPAELPGIGANYTLLGFTVDGKKVVITNSDPGGSTKKLLLEIADPKEAEKEEVPKGKVNPQRLIGMKAALVDIEAGKLKQKFPPFPDSVQQRNYTDLLKKECGVESQVVGADAAGPGKALDEMNGYNDVMRVEIEHRFGVGILAKLSKNANEAKK